MQLRKKVNPPKRYKPELKDSTFEQRYTPHTDKPVFDIPYVDFNPYLPPAAFPTLDSVEVALRQSQGNINRNSKPLQNNRSDEHDFPDISSDNNSEPPSFAQMSSPSTRRANGSNPRLVRYPGLTENDVETDLEHSNTVHNPTYRENWKILSEHKKRSGTQWNTTEMETSDEDDGECEDEPFDVSGAKAKTSSTRGKPPEWEEITLALRLEILHNLTEHGHTTTEAVERLGLMQLQQDALNHDITHFNQRLDVEDTHLELLRMETHERLLHGKLHIEAAQLDLMRDGKHVDEAKERHFKGVKSRMNRFAQADYKQLMNNHLDGLLVADQVDYSLTSTSALRRAQAFLKSKGMDVSFAGEWTKVYEGIGRAGGGNVLREQPIDVTPALSSRTPPEGDLNLINARSIYAETIGRNPPQSIVQDAAIQTPLTLPQLQSSCIRPPQTTQALDLNPMDLSAGGGAYVNPYSTSRKLNKESDTSGGLPNFNPAKYAEVPHKLPLFSKAQTIATRPPKMGIKRTSSGNEITGKSGKNQAPKTPSNKLTEKQPSNPDSTISQGSVNDGHNTIPARRRPTKLTLTTHALETPAEPGFTPSGNPSDHEKTRSQLSSDKPVRSPTARRLPARYSDSLPDPASSAGSSNRRSSDSKLMTEWTSPSQTVSPLTTSMEKASIEDGVADKKGVARVAHTGVEGQKVPGRRGRPRETSGLPMPAELDAPFLGVTAPASSDKGKNPAGKKVASRTRTPNLVPGPSSKVAPPKPKKGPGRRSKK